MNRVLTTAGCLLLTCGIAFADPSVSTGTNGEPVPFTPPPPPSVVLPLHPTGVPITSVQLDRIIDLLTKLYYDMTQQTYLLAEIHNKEVHVK